VREFDRRIAGTASSIANSAGNRAVRLVLLTGILKFSPKPWTFGWRTQMPGARLDLALTCCPVQAGDNFFNRRLGITE
jgi:hypothetical protein